MRPLNYDVRHYWRKFQSDTVENEDGTTEPVWSVSGPFALAFVPGAERRTLTEQGFSYDGTTMFVIADRCKEFRAGDILSDGTNDLYEVTDAKTFPTEQQLYVRGLA